MVHFRWEHMILADLQIREQARFSVHPLMTAVIIVFLPAMLQAHLESIKLHIL